MVLRQWTQLIIGQTPLDKHIRNYLIYLLLLIVTRQVFPLRSAVQHYKSGITH